MASTSPLYVLSFFRQEEGTLRLGISAAGAKWLITGPLYTPPAGEGSVLHDPSIIKWTDGNYYICYTSGSAPNNSFGVARSPDLVNWTFVKSVAHGIAGGNQTWAPEWFVDTDGSLHVLVSVGPTGDTAQQIYEIHPTSTTDFSQPWSAPVQLGGLPANVIDPCMVKNGATYTLFYKNETTKFIEKATCATLAGVYNVVGSGDWAGWGSGVEGPTVFQTPSGWRIVMDGYAHTPNNLIYSDSPDLVTWTAAAKCVIPTDARHGTVVRTTDHDFEHAVLGLIGSALTASDLLLNADGSSTTSPRQMGPGWNLAAGAASRLYLSGDDGVQVGNGKRTQLYGHWGIEVYGNVRSGSPPAFVNGTTGDASLNVIGTTTGAPMILNWAPNGQTGDLMQHWVNAILVSKMSSTGGIRPGNGRGTAANGPTIYGGSGAPTIAGALGDWYLRGDTPGVANQRLYVCTVAGAAGVAVWTGIL